MFTSGLKESQWTEEDGRTVQVDWWLIFMKMVTLMMRVIMMMTGEAGRTVKNELSEQIVIDFFNSLKCFCFFILLNNLTFCRLFIRPMSNHSLPMSMTHEITEDLVENKLKFG